MINSLYTNTNYLRSFAQNLKLTSVEDQRCSKVAKATIQSLFLGTSAYFLSSRINYLPSIFSALAIGHVARSLINASYINDYYNPYEFAKIKDQARSSDIFKALQQHGIQILNENILTVEELRQKLNNFPEPIIEVTNEITKLIKQFQQAVEGVDFNEGDEAVMRKRPDLIKKHDIFMEKITKILKNSEEVAPLIFLLATISLEIDKWEKAHTVVEKGFFFSTKKLVVNNYHNLNEIARMRKEALTSDLFQIIKIHGSVTRVLEAQILSLEEIKNKLENVPEEVKSLSPKDLSILKMNPLLKFFGFDKVSQFRIEKYDNQVGKDLKSIPEQLATKSKLYIRSVQDVAKWETSHWISSILGL